MGLSVQPVPPPIDQLWPRIVAAPRRKNLESQIEKHRPIDNWLIDLVRYILFDLPKKLPQYLSTKVLPAGPLGLVPAHHSSQLHHPLHHP